MTYRPRFTAAAAAALVTVAAGSATALTAGTATAAPAPSRTAKAPAHTKPAHQLHTARKSAATTPSRSRTNASAQALVMGARAKDTSFGVMDSTIGPVDASRWFSGGSNATLPSTFTRKYAGTAIPASADVWASFNTATDANLRSYVTSADPGTKMVLHHEPEGDFSSGAAYVSWFDRERAVIKAANPNMPVVHAAAAYGYRANGEGADCSYVPKDADIYTIDTYRRTAADMVPLAQDDRFQRWLSCVPAGKPIGITEYGRGVAPFTSQMNALRAANIAKDATYLRSNPAGHKAVVWMYWWTSGGAGNWRFTDQASINAWSAAAKG